MVEHIIIILGPAGIMYMVDKEALEVQRRPYSTQTVIKASPGSHRD